MGCDWQDEPSDTTTTMAHTYTHTNSESQTAGFDPMPAKTLQTTFVNKSYLQPQVISR